MLLKSGYSKDELKIIGDWSSIEMPDTYARRKGLTTEEKRFAEDVRVVK